MTDERERTDDENRITPAYESGEMSLVRTVPSLARIAAAAYWRGARWTVRASARAGSRVMRAAVTGQDPAELFRSTGADMRARARRVLGLSETQPEPQVAITPEAAELLRRSADVNFDEDSHPAYTRILEDLAPDEARILRLLIEQGPQPSVDVRSGLVPLKSTSELVASGLNLIGPEAGCRHLSDVPAYLNNLFRLGLVWFSSEPLPHTQSYQVLEAQPEVAEAMSRAGHTRTVRRSIHLTPFGHDFCKLCLPVDTGEFEALGGAVASPGQVGQPDAGEHGDVPG
jgi:hypothetical protein